MDALETGEARAEPERRASRRFPVVMPLAYKVFRHTELIRGGVGRTVNMSSSGVLFRADLPLERGCRIELSIEWPLQDGKREPLRLQALCEIVRTQEEEAAVRIMRHVFRAGPAEEAAEGDR